MCVSAVLSELGLMTSNALLRRVGPLNMTIVRQALRQRVSARTFFELPRREGHQSVASFRGESIEVLNKRVIAVPPVLPSFRAFSSTTTNSTTNSRTSSTSHEAADSSCSMEYESSSTINFHNSSDHENDEMMQILSKSEFNASETIAKLRKAAQWTPQWDPIFVQQAVLQYERHLNYLDYYWHYRLDKGTSTKKSSIHEMDDTGAMEDLLGLDLLDWKEIMSSLVESLSALYIFYLNGEREESSFARLVFSFSPIDPCMVLHFPF